MPRTLYLVSFYFAPLGRADGINRTHLARMLADLGWKVEVICAEPLGVDECIAALAIKRAEESLE